MCNHFYHFIKYALSLYNLFSYFQIIQSVLMTIANNFVTDKNSGEVMTVGWVKNLTKTAKLFHCGQIFFFFKPPAA